MRLLAVKCQLLGLHFSYFRHLLHPARLVTRGILSSLFLIPQTLFSMLIFGRFFSQPAIYSLAPTHDMRLPWTDDHGSSRGQQKYVGSLIC
jgi:hypothetical protein